MQASKQTNIPCRGGQDNVRGLLGARKYREGRRLVTGTNVVLFQINHSSVKSAHLP